MSRISSSEGYCLAGCITAAISVSVVLISLMALSMTQLAVRFPEVQRIGMIVCLTVGGIGVGGLAVAVILACVSKHLKGKEPIEDNEPKESEAPKARPQPYPPIKSNWLPDSHPSWAAPSGEWYGPFY